MSVVHRYRVMCIEENKMVTTYGTEPPTLCPNDHADRTINPFLTVVADTFKKNQVEIFNPTNGNFQYTCICLSIPAGEPDDISTHDFSWPMDLKIWKTEFYSGTEHVGDVLDVVVDPDRVVGLLNEDSTTGSTIMSVSSTVFEHPSLTCGVDVSLDNSGNSEKVGIIKGVDRNNLKLELDTPLPHNFTTGTKICLNIKMIKNVLIHQPNKMYTVGQKGFNSKNIDAGTVVRFFYKNSTGLAKNVYIEMEYNYV